MRSTIWMLLLSILLFSTLVGCAKIVKIYPLYDTDYSVLKKGESAKFDGVLMSPMYVKEVLGVEK